MNIISQTLERQASEYGIELTQEMVRQFEIYAEMLLEWNQKINLTAITEPEEIAVKHFLDSLLPLKAVEFPSGAEFIDIGTGAGFPGVPIKILRPDLRLTLLDSLNKRMRFLSELSSVLGQDNNIVHGRAEQDAHSPVFRERFDIVSARAVAALPVLCEYCLPFLKRSGVFIALKASGAGLEYSTAETAIDILGGELVEVKNFILPPNHERNIIIIKKISQTPPEYPRKGVKISKKPL